MCRKITRIIQKSFEGMTWDLNFACVYLKTRWLLSVQILVFGNVINISCKYLLMGDRQSNNYLLRKQLGLIEAILVLKV